MQPLSPASDTTFGSATSALQLLKEMGEFSEDVSQDVTESKEGCEDDHDSDDKVKHLQIALHKSQRETKKLTSKVSELETQLKAVHKEATRKVQNVRHFWKDKIYGEQTKSGIILKRAMQSSSII